MQHIFYAMVGESPFRYSHSGTTLARKALEFHTLDSAPNYMYCPRLPFRPWLRAGDLAMDASAFWGSSTGMGKEARARELLSNRLGGDGNGLFDRDAASGDEGGIFRVYPA